VTPADQTPADPGEGRLVAYLAELRENPPPTDAALARRVHRSTRWQQAVRGPLQVIGHLSGALADGLTALLGGTRGPRR
jgi:hypothetical protein